MFGSREQCDSLIGNPGRVGFKGLIRTTSHWDWIVWFPWLFGWGNSDSLLAELAAIFQGLILGPAAADSGVAAAAMPRELSWLIEWGFSSLWSSWAVVLVIFLLFFFLCLTSSTNKKKTRGLFRCCRDTGFSHNGCRQRSQIVKTYLLETRSHSSSLLYYLLFGSFLRFNYPQTHLLQMFAYTHTYKLSFLCIWTHENHFFATFIGNQTETSFVALFFFPSKVNRDDVFVCRLEGSSKP